MRTQTLTVGIPAYNEGANIKKLILSILAQKNDGFELKKIVISSDGSSDATVRNVKSIKDKRIVVFGNKDRQGIARGLNQIINNTTSDVLVTLDADIKITNKRFLSKLIRPILYKNADLTSSAIREVSQKTFTARVLNISMRLKEILFKVFKNGNNIYNCYGLARGYSKRFYSICSYPVSAGNDMYCYLKALKGNFKFVYVPEITVYYKLPENIQDHKYQSERFFIALKHHEKLFGSDFVRNETRIPPIVYLKAAVKAVPLLINNPLEAFYYFVIQLYIRIKPKEPHKNQEKWKIASSSKGI